MKLLPKVTTGCAANDTVGRACTGGTGVPSTVLILLIFPLGMVAKATVSATDVESTVASPYDVFEQLGLQV
jgi:hypothetical protein